MSLESYIYIDEKRVGRQEFVPCGVRFELNPSNLIDINLAQENSAQLKLSSDRLTNLRYYALLSSQANKQLSPGYALPSQLVITTNYLQQEKSISVIRSVINFEGKIIQKIEHNLWQNTQLLNNLLNAHYWLSSQILSQLSLKPKNYLEFSSWGFSFILIVLVALPIFYWLSVNYFIKIILIIFSFFIFKKSTKYLLKDKLKTWVLNQLLFGFLSRGVKKRKFAFQILTILG